MMDEQTLLRLTVQRSLYANHVIQSRDVFKVLYGRVPKPSEVRYGYDYIRSWIERGYLVEQSRNDYRLTDIGRFWCGAVNVTNPS